MNNTIAFQERGWEDHVYWQAQDKKTLRRINQLLQDIDRNGHNGIGKSEALSGNLAGYWSKRIDDTKSLSISSLLTGCRVFKADLFL